MTIGSMPIPGADVLQAVKKPWLKSYPAGVSAEIDPSQYDSLV